MTTFHTACKTLDHQPAFSDWEEAAELFRRVAQALGPCLVSLCVMPDHIHAITTEPVQGRLRAVLSGYTRWRNHRRGRRGALFAGVPEAHARQGGDKILRDQRYVELNPCRSGLVSDPLGWALSTWRDRMGLAWPPVRRRARDVARWLAYATRDDYVLAEPLPYRLGDRRPEDVLAAVSSLTRRTPEALRRRGPARTLLVASLRWLTPLSAADVGDLAGLTPSGVHKVEPRGTPGLELVQRVAGDARFAALDGPLPDFGAYRARQRRNARGPGPGWD